MRDLTGDLQWRREFWQAIGQALSAHLVMLRDAAIIDDASAAALLTAADAVRRGTPPDIDGSLSLVAAFDERFDSQTPPGVAGGGRIGRATHDLAATAQRLVLRDRALSLIAALNASRAALLDLADEHAFTLMNAWSGGVPIQPTTFAHFLTGTAAPLGRSARFLRGAYEAVDRTPLGAASLVGPGLAIDREEVAELLGSEGPAESTFDALAAVDHLVALGDAARLAVSPLARLGRELLLWARTDPQALRFAADLLAPADASAPGFRPPRALERLIAGARAVQSDAETAARLTEDQPYGPTGELADDAVIDVGNALRGAAHVAESAAAILSGPIEVNRAWLARGAGRDLVTMGDLALLLMTEEGIDPAAAQEIASLTTTRARQEGLEASGVGPQMIDAAALLVIGRELGIEIERLGAFLAPRRFIEKRTLLGGPAAPAVRDLLARERNRLDADRQWFAATERRIALAKENLEIRTGEILAAVAAG